MEAILITEADRARYDAAVAASPYADFMQSYEWGEVKRATGWDALRLLVLDGDRVRAACSVLRTRPLRAVPPLLYAPRGPIIDDGDDQALRVLLDAIRAHAGGAFMFKCDPPVEAGSPPAEALARAGLRSVRSGAFGGVQPTAVMVLDLSIGVDKVFEGFKSKWRYNVRLAERKGVTVRSGTAADIPAFHALYAETAARDGFTGRGRTYFETLFRVMEPTAMCEMLIAEYEGAPLAAIVLLRMGDRVIYVYGASSNEHRNLMPNHLIQWHAIQRAAASGARIYDFRGVSPVRDGVPVQEHIAGLNRFKEGFGARYVEYVGELDLPLRRGWYQAWLRGAPAAMRLRARLRGTVTPGD